MELMQQNPFQKAMKEELRKIGINPKTTVYSDLSIPALYEEALRRREAVLTCDEALVVNTAPRTGRSPNDKFFVKEPSSEQKIAWGKGNKPFPEEKFESLVKKLKDYLSIKELFIQNCSAGADERYRMSVRVISTSPVGALFSKLILLDAFTPKKSGKLPPLTILHAPGFHADPAKDGTNSEAFILIHLGQRTILIGGTAYCGEIKKSVFTVMNYWLPQLGVMPMHCSANFGAEETDTAIFFGLSGTGKTTLSASNDRTLIGDDEHGWSERGVFNFEGGCYAKVIRLSPEYEPEIYATTRHFGTLLENVVIDPESREIDLDDQSITENTRATYSIEQIPHMSLTGTGGHPRHIIMLTCDAFGVLPPVSRLTPEQAKEHFIAGYTAKVAGTEAGIVEPQATFSPCFGGPFMPLAPSVYADLLADKITKHHAQVWLVNTGWIRGPYGVGERISLPWTRAMIKSILNDCLSRIETIQDPVFQLAVPISCPGVPSEILSPAKSWQDPAAYEKKAKELLEMFRKHKGQVTN